MRSFTVANLVFVPLLAAGCMATVSNEGYGPEMAYAAPGVQVIVDYDEPIFYADSFYWRFYGGGWYRSPHHNSGWVYATPPPAVRGIDRPQAYVHYRPSGWTGRRDRVPQQPAVRGQPAPQVYQQQPRAAQQQWQQQPRAPQQQGQQQPRAPQQQWQQQPHAPQQQGRQQQRAPQRGPRDREQHGEGDHHDRH